MTLTHKRGLTASIARRITVAGGIFLFAMIGLTSAAMTTLLLKRGQERTTAWMDAKVEAVAQALDAHDQTSKLMVERFFKVFSDQFGRAFALDEQAGKLSQLGIALNGYHNPCDKFTEFTGAGAAVLMKRGESFVAISTSLMDERGERALSLSIGADHPGYGLLQAGSAYVGRAAMFGRPYAVRIQPIRDLQDRVVGGLLVAVELTEFNRALDKLVEATRFFDSGGVYVLNDQAVGPDRHVVAFAAPGSLAASQGRGAAIETIFTAHRAAGEGAPFRDFRPLLRPEDSDRFAVARSSKGTGWLVVGEASSREAGQAQWATLVPFLALLGGTAAVLCAGQYALIRRWVGRPLAQATLELERVASGDLSVAVVPARADEIGQMMRGVESMRLRFVDLLGALRASAAEISTASAEIASGNQDLSQRTEATAARLQETASAMEQACSSVELAAAATRSADILSSQASLAAERGGSSVEQVVGCMKNISASSRRITEITGVIDGIAFQTNLLALNAAVEAARAGDSGRGFSVVAAEVRTLAHRAAAAAKEIKQLLADSASEVETGHGLADAARERMADIASSVQRLTEALRTIHESGAAQTSRLGQVNQSVNTVDAMTQQNAALVEQSAAASASLRAQAAGLVQLMAIFRLERPSRDSDAGTASGGAPYQRSAAVRTGASHNSSSSSSRTHTESDAPAVSSEVA